MTRRKIRLSEKSKLWLLLIAIVFIGGVTFVVCYWLISMLKWWTILLVGGYAIILELLDWLKKKVKGKCMDYVFKVIMAPMISMYFIVKMAQPFIIIVGTYFFLLLFAFGVPAVLLKGLSHIRLATLMPETIVFLVISLGSIVCAHFYSVTKWMIHLSPFQDRGIHQYESYMEKLAVYIIHPTNVTFLLYLSYFVFLAVSGFLQIQSGRWWISDTMDAAILKAFLVFIAFSNMRTKAKETDIEAKELLKHTMGLFVHGDA